MSAGSSPEIREAVDADKGDGGCGIVVDRKLVHEVVPAARGEKLCAVVEAGGI